MTDWRSATCAECGAKCLEGQTHVEHNAGWLKRMLMLDYTDLALNGYPGWETKDQGGGWGKAPPTVHLAIKNKVDKSSDDIACEWDDVSEGRFYNRDQSRDGYVFVGEGEYYDAYFYFQKLSDAVAFMKRYGGSVQ